MHTEWLPTTLLLTSSCTSETTYVVLLLCSNCLSTATSDLRIPRERVRLIMHPLCHAMELIIDCSAKIGRKTLGRELATIADYRLRLNQYRTDVSLRDAHVKAPWISVW